MDLDTKKNVWISGYQNNIVGSSWIPKTNFMDLNLNTKKNFIDLDTGSGYQKNNLRIRIPDLDTKKKNYGSGYRIWIPKQHFMDLDTGSGF